MDCDSACTEQELNQETGYDIPSIETLDGNQKQTMYARYTMIAPILPFIADDKMRCRLISSIAAEYQLSLIHI